MSSSLVIVPTYQERALLPVLLAALRRSAPAVDVLVVDDASPDGTGALAASAGAHVLSREAKQGLGPAYRAGFGWALERNYTLIATMDADLSHDPVVLPTLMAAAQTSDLVIGSRYVPGGQIRHWPLRRRLLSHGGNRYVRLLTGLPVRDATAGYRVYRREVLEVIDVAGLRSDGYAFQVETALRAHRAGFVTSEQPIVFEERRAGESKLSRNVVFEAMWRVPVWAVGHPRRPRDMHPRSVVAAGPGHR